MWLLEIFKRGLCLPLLPWHYHNDAKALYPRQVRAKGATIISNYCYDENPALSSWLWGDSNGYIAKKTLSCWKYLRSFYILRMLNHFLNRFLRGLNNSCSCARATASAFNTCPQALHRTWIKMAFLIGRGWLVLVVLQEWHFHYKGRPTWVLRTQTLMILILLEKSIYGHMHSTKIGILLAL